MTPQDEKILLGSLQSIAHSLKQITKYLEPEIIHKESNNVKIISLKDKTPKYHGGSQMVKIKDKYFRTWDAEVYSSGLQEITKKEFNRLKKYEEAE